jgi:hypothetical protein
MKIRLAPDPVAGALKLFEALLNAERFPFLDGSTVIRKIGPRSYGAASDVRSPWQLGRP